MNHFHKLFASACIAAAAITTSNMSAMAFTLSNGPGDGTVTVGVDGYGSFGSAVGGVGTSDALYDPLGAGAPAGTTFDSGVAIRFGDSGPRQFLTSGAIGSSGGLTDPGVTGSPTTATSSFLFNGLSFNLTQTLTALFTGGVQTGARLTQTYAITNTTLESLNFELVRYLDGDLLFDGSLDDGGGRLVANGSEILFETDSATGADDATTFVGILTQGGTDGDFEIDSFSGLRSRIIAGNALDNTIAGDGNGDSFIDAGAGYDVTLALSNLFSLGSGSSATYVTSTIFGAGIPDEVIEEPPTEEPVDVPEPASVLSLLALGAFGTSTLKRKQQTT